MASVEGPEAVVAYPLSASSTITMASAQCKPLPLRSTPSDVFWETLRPVFFNPVLKVTALRLVLLSTVVTLALGGAWIDAGDRGILLWLVLLPCILVHHIISAYKFAFFIRLLDLVLIIAEIVLLGLFSKHFTFNRWSSMPRIGAVIAMWSLLVCLIFLAMCRVMAVIRKKGGSLLKPFDVLQDSQRLKGLPMKTSSAAASILLGRAIWKTRFPGESTAVRLARGALGGVLILVMVVYGIVNIAVYPVRETALTPIKEYRSPGTPDGFKLEEPEWHVAFVLSDVDPAPSVESFFEAVQISPLWDNSSEDKPVCADYTDFFTSVDVSAFGCQLYFASCPPRAIITDIARDLHPDILVNINFTMLGQPDVPATENLASIAVQVIPGLTSNQLYLLRTSTPISVLPSTNNLAELDYEIRQIFKKPALSALGMFESTDSFASVGLKSLFPDPLAKSASNNLLTIAENYATLRLFVTGGDSSVTDIRIIQDYREKAVLDGFAVIGGLWTFFCAIFALFFGISMTRIVFDMKPLSVFGIAQQFERNTIVEEYFAKYPQIRTEIEFPHRDRGLLTLFRDHLIDVELFQDHIDESEKKRLETERAELEKATVDPATVDPTLRYRL